MFSNTDEIAKLRKSVEKRVEMQIYSDQPKNTDIKFFQKESPNEEKDPKTAIFVEAIETFTEDEMRKILEKPFITQNILFKKYCENKVSQQINTILKDTENPIQNKIADIDDEKLTIKINDYLMKISDYLSKNKKNKFDINDLQEIFGDKKQEAEYIFNTCYLIQKDIEGKYLFKCNELSTYFVRTLIISTIPANDLPSRKNNLFGKNIR